ncbi:MAG: hypothetical protein HGA36_03195 [Candidatus Moranbacteria bacterium]|nr:hypothetical protein [Candidatus Moranbacteria bacterium]
MKHRSIVHVKDDYWKVTFIEKCNLRDVYFVCDIDPSKKTLEEILELPQVGKDKEISFRQAVVELGFSKIPDKFRQQKKLFRRLTDDASPEEHY